MIQNLNKFTFAAFGELLPESDATGGFPLQPEWRQESVSFSQDEVWVQRVDADGLGQVGIDSDRLGRRLRRRRRIGGQQDSG